MPRKDARRVSTTIPEVPELSQDYEGAMTRAGHVRQGLSEPNPKAGEGGQGQAVSGGRWLMPRFLQILGPVRRRAKIPRSDTWWVRAIPGGVPRSSLESWVLEVLAGRPAYPWESLVAETAHYLRRCESPKVLAVLDEGFWGGWAWSVLAREELHRLDGVLILITGKQSPSADLDLSDPVGQPRDSPDAAAVRPSPPGPGPVSIGRLPGVRG